MLRFSLAVRRMDRFRNEYIRGTAQGEQFGGKAEMLWTCAGEGWWIYQRMLNMELPGRRRRGGPQMSFVDVVKEEMQRKDGTGQKQIIGCGNP